MQPIFQAAEIYKLNAYVAKLWSSFVSIHFSMFFGMEFSCIGRELSPDEVDNASRERYLNW